MGPVALSFALALAMTVTTPTALQDAPIAKEAPAATTKPWTILIYGAADNNCDGHMFEFLNGVRRAVADDPGLELVLFMDRSAGFSTDTRSLGEDFTGARIYRLKEKSAERLAGGEEFPEIRLDQEWEADSADPANLGKFLRFGKAHFPAKRTALIIYSHANGITMCPDEQSGHDMSITALSTAMTEAEGVDFTGLELCNMGGVEVAYQWRPGNGGFSTEILLGIPNAGPPLDWNRIFGRIHTPGHPAAAGRDDCIDPAKLTARDFGELAIEEGGKARIAAAKSAGARQNAAHEAAVCFDLFAVEDVKRAVDAFAVELARGGAAAKAALAKARGPGADGTVMNYVDGELASDHPFVDLHDLLRRAAACADLPDEARAAARAAMAAVDEMVVASFGMSGFAGFEAGKNGVAIALPGAEASAIAARVSRGSSTIFGWYAPFETRHPDEPKQPLGDWAWCRDGATRDDGTVGNWFELLDAWFDAGQAADGGVNGWRW